MTQEERTAACDILKYIRKQPGIKHTAEGIAKYWIFQQRLEEKTDVVLAAIDYLVKEGFLEEVQREDTRCYYRLNQAKMDDVPLAIKILNHNT